MTRLLLWHILLTAALVLPVYAVTRPGPPTMAAPKAAPSNASVTPNSSKMQRELAKLARKHLRRARWSLWWLWPFRNVARAKAELSLAEGLAKIAPMPGVMAEIERVRVRVEKRSKGKAKGKSVE